MDRELYNKFRRLEARIDHLEELSQDLSNYIAKLEQGLNEQHDKLADEINSAFHEIVSKIEELEENEEKRRKDI